METQQGNGRQPGGITGKGFVKGDARINRHGRPAGFDAARQMALAIACEDVTLSNGRKMSAIEAMLRSWARSKDHMLQLKFVEIAYGKVPDRIEATGLENKPTLILHYPHEMPGYVPPDKGANYRSGRVFPRSLPASASNGET